MRNRLEAASRRNDSRRHVSASRRRGAKERARLQRERLTTRQISVLEAAFQFLEHGGHDYASRRLVEHFLLHSELGLKVAQVARLVGLDRCTSSRHRPCSSTQVVQAIHLSADASHAGECGVPGRGLPPDATRARRRPAQAPPGLFRRGSRQERCQRTDALRTGGDEPPYREIQDFRQRQHHEQAYRIGVYDQFLDAVPCGYDKQSPNPKRPRFPRGPLQMLGWLVALVAA